MNLRNIFKPLAQQLLNAAFPMIKLELLSLISQRLTASLPAAQAQVAMASISAALDGWQIKL